MKPESISAITRTFKEKHIEAAFNQQQFNNRQVFIRVAISLILLLEIIRLANDFTHADNLNIAIRTSIISCGWIIIGLSFYLPQNKAQIAITSYIYLYMAIKVIRMYLYHHSLEAGTADLIGTTLFIYLLFPLNWLPKCILAFTHTLLSILIYLPELSIGPAFNDLLGWAITANALGAYFSYQSEARNRELYLKTINLRKSLKETNRLRQHSDLSADLISHEIRSPIIAAAAHLQHLPNSEHKNRIKQLHDQSLNFIKEWSSQSQQLSNKLQKITVSRAYLNEQIQHSINQLTASQQRHINFTPNNQPLPSIRVNERILGVTLSNILDNAIHHGKSDNNITIQLRQYPHHIGIRVRDFGKGMNDEEIEQAFVSQPQHKDSKHNAGLGIGLSILRKLMSYDGGDINIQSTPNLGSAFIILIPIAKD